MDVETTEVELGHGTPRDRDGYAAYVRFCQIAEVNPAPFVRWLELDNRAFRAESPQGLPVQ